MTAGLRDPFDVIHQKVVETKGGSITLDYISWSQVADRLDDAAPGWSFEVVQLHDDWCLGRLTIGERRFENVGYAENADQAWKKEALKDAVSDALKRCAALAGVGRYLYDKDSPAPHQAVAQRPPSPPRQAASSRPAGEPPLYTDEDDEVWAKAKAVATGAPILDAPCAEHPGAGTWRPSNKGDGGFWHGPKGIVPNKDGSPGYHSWWPPKERK